MSTFNHKDRKVSTKEHEYNVLIYIALCAL